MKLVEEARRRGPKPRAEARSPSGFRLTDRVRFELQLSAVFVGTTTLQQTLDVAVEEFLGRAHRLPGFDDALALAERAQRQRADVPEIGRAGS